MKHLFVTFLFFIIFQRSAFSIIIFPDLQIKSCSGALNNLDVFNPFISDGSAITIDSVALGNDKLLTSGSLRVIKSINLRGRVVELRIYRNTRGFTETINRSSKAISQYLRGVNIWTLSEIEIRSLNLEFNTHLISNLLDSPITALAIELPHKSEEYRSLSQVYPVLYSTLKEKLNYELRQVGLTHPNPNFIVSPVNEVVLINPEGAVSIFLIEAE
jgi:hypothetical protein